MVDPLLFKLTIEKQHGGNLVASRRRRSNDESHV